MAVSDQQDVFDFLHSGTTFAATSGGEDVRRIDTHCASIFLTGARAWKLKRAVRFPYLDFSTVDLRKQALTNELILNRRIAPDLYLGLHAITRQQGGQLELDGPGEPVDWVLEMRRFEDGALLSELADRHTLPPGLLQDLTDGIVAFHCAAEVVPEPDGHARFAAVVRMNVTTLEAYADLLGAENVAAVARGLFSALSAGEHLLRQRSAAGRVRHVHGDLHLANIAVIAERATPFDCLEFDAELATIDTLYDLAFLIMDLWQRDMRAEANLVFNRYLDLSGEDEGGLALMPLFLACRAVIRAHVAAAQAKRAGAGPGLAENARRYLRLALTLLHPAPAVLVATGGLSGSGKSTLGRGLAPWIGRAPGARIVRSDVLRKRLAGAAPETRLPDCAYTPEAGQTVYTEMMALTATALDNGQAAVADAVFAAGEERENIERIAVERAIPFLGLWLDCGENQRVARIETRRHDASDADADVARAQSSYALPDLKSWETVNANLSSAQVLESASALLRQRQMLSREPGVPAHVA